MILSPQYLSSTSLKVSPLKGQLYAPYKYNGALE
jgi:hypothetical protein